MVSKQQSFLILRLSMGCIFVIIGFVLTLLVSCLVKSTNTYVRTLKPDGIIFEMWRKNPVPMYFEFYMFNWTNPEDIYNLDMKPQFQEIGPFVFRTTVEKINITWNANKTVTYGSMRHWYFEEEKSIGPLSTKIYNVNALAFTAANIMRFQSYFLKRGLDLSLRSLSPKLYVVKSVREFLFDGYQDTLLNIVNGLPLPEVKNKPVFDKVGWFYARNGSTTHEGIFNVGTTEENIGELYEWNYNNKTSYFTGDCNKIKNSAGDFYPIPLQKNHLTLFWPETCRPLTMDFVEETTVGGTLGYKYIVGDSFLDNGSKIHENLCYNTKGENIPYGLLNISTCKYGAPAFLSLPHFYKTDPYYVDAIIGLKPHKIRHEMFAIHEPTTGIPLHVEARFQLNLLLSSVQYISIFERVPRVCIPVMWIETKGRIPWFYNLILKLFLQLSIVLYSLASIVVVLGVFLVWFSLKNRGIYLRSNFDVLDADIDRNNVEQVKMSLLNQSHTPLESRT